MSPSLFFPHLTITAYCIYALGLDYSLNRLINMKSWLKKRNVFTQK